MRSRNKAGTTTVVGWEPIGCRSLYSKSKNGIQTASK